MVGIGRVALPVPYDGAAMSVGSYLKEIFPFEHNGYRYTRRRTAQMAAAKEKGTHTSGEWLALSAIFGRCVSCGIPYSELNGGVPTKDHIEPIALGGCDCIGNLQPKCRECNSMRGIGDLRNAADPQWVKKFIEQMARGT